jgi:hypothetical protein
VVAHDLERVLAVASAECVSRVRQRIEVQRAGEQRREPDGEGTRCERRQRPGGEIGEQARGASHPGADDGEEPSAARDVVCLDLDEAAEWQAGEEGERAGRGPEGLAHRPVSVTPAASKVAISTRIAREAWSSGRASAAPLASPRRRPRSRRGSRPSASRTTA